MQDSAHGSTLRSRFRRHASERLYQQIATRFPHAWHATRPCAMTIQAPEDADFEGEVPLLIIGAGADGLCGALAARAAGLGAARAAVKAGMEPVLIERDAVPSGSTALSAGLIPAAGTRFQAASGIT